MHQMSHKSDEAKNVIITYCHSHSPGLGCLVESVLGHSRIRHHLVAGVAGVEGSVVAAVLPHAFAPREQEPSKVPSRTD